MYNKLLNNISIKDIVDARKEEIKRLNKYFKDNNIKYEQKGIKMPSKREWKKAIKGIENPPYYYLTFRVLNEINSILREKIEYDKNIEKELNNKNRENFIM